jgi:hypothetical protein
MSVLSRSCNKDKDNFLNEPERSGHIVKTERGQISIISVNLTLIPLTVYWPQLLLQVSQSINKQ